MHKLKCNDGLTLAISTDDLILSFQSENDTAQSCQIIVVVHPCSMMVFGCVYITMFLTLQVLKHGRVKGVAVGYLMLLVDFEISRIQEPTLRAKRELGIDQHGPQDQYHQALEGRSQAEEGC